MSASISVRSYAKPKREEAEARLEALLLEGLAGGGDIPLTPGFWKDLKAEARGIAVKHKARKRP